MLCGEKAKLTGCRWGDIAGIQSGAGKAMRHTGSFFMRNKKTTRPCDEPPINQEHKRDRADQTHRVQLFVRNIYFNRLLNFCGAHCLRFSFLHFSGSDGSPSMFFRKAATQSFLK